MRLLRPQSSKKVTFGFATQGLRLRDGKVGSQVVVEDRNLFRGRGIVEKLRDKVEDQATERRSSADNLPCFLRSAYKRDSMENKPASLLVVSLGKALNGTPPPLCGRQVAYPYFTGLQNCEVANPACQTTIGYAPVAVRLVGGGATSHSRLVRNGLPSFP